MAQNEQALPTDVHPEEQPSWWEILGFWAAIFVITAAFWYAVARWLIAPIVRWFWPLLQPLVATYGEQVLTAAVLAAVAMAIFAIAREK